MDYTETAKAISRKINCGDRWDNKFASEKVFGALVYIMHITSPSQQRPVQFEIIRVPNNWNTHRKVQTIKVRTCNGMIWSIVSKKNNNHKVVGFTK